jgi:hypothetical protein
MKTSTLAAAALAIGLSCTGLSAMAQEDHSWKGGSDNRNWDAAHSYDNRSHHDRPMTRRDDVYRGHDGRYYCRRSDGTTGLVVGAIGGGLLGNAIGGDALGTLLGAGAGAVVGSSIDRGHVHCR